MLMCQTRCIAAQNLVHMNLCWFHCVHIRGQDCWHFLHCLDKFLFTFLWLLWKFCWPSLKAPQTLLIFWLVIHTGENTHYAEYVWHSSVIAPRILEGIWCNMACAKLGASGPWNLGTRDWWNLPKKVWKMAKQGKKIQKMRDCQKTLTKISQLLKMVNKSK